MVKIVRLFFYNCLLNLIAKNMYLVSIFIFFIFKYVFVDLSLIDSIYNNKEFLLTIGKILQHDSKSIQFQHILSFYQLQFILE